MIETSATGPKTFHRPLATRDLAHLDPFGGAPRSNALMSMSALPKIVVVARHPLPPTRTRQGLASVFIALPSGWTLATAQPS